jgi:capsular polysaccharide biosynthesis protein
MELREYGRILWRRWWIIALLLIVVLGVSLATYRAPAPHYTATMRFAIGIEGEEPVSAVSGEGRSDAWLASEYLADDLSEVLKGGRFAAEISRRVGFDVPAGAIFASRAHRIMTVNVTWPQRDQIQAIAEAVGAAVEDGGAAYFPQLDGVSARAVLIDGPGIGQTDPGLKDRLDLPLRLFVALIAGAAIAFLWHYLDNTVRDRAEVEGLGVPVLGEIPRKTRSWPKTGSRGADDT